MSLDKPIPALRPIAGGLPFNNLPGPLTPQEALRLPGDNLIKRIFWAMLMMSALRAHAKKQRAIEANQQQEFEDMIAKELKLRKREHKLHTYVGREDGGQGHEEGFDAGEIDENYNGAPEAVEMYENHDEKKHEETAITWIKKIIRIYYITYLIIFNMMGLKRNEAGELSDPALDKWLVQNDHRLEFRQLKMHMLNSLSEHSKQFDLVQIDLAERFLNRLTATLIIEQKTVQDVQALNQAEFGQALAASFAHQMQELTAVSNDMVQQTAKAVADAGVQLKPAEAAPNPTPSTLSHAITEMGPPQHAQNHGEQVALSRLATVQTMFPRVPKPQNTQRRDHEKKTGEKHAHAKKPGHDLAKFNTHQAMGNELKEYADAMGVDPRVLEQASDHSRLKLFKEESPAHAADHKALRETSAIPQHEKQAAASKSPMSTKPTPPMPSG